MTDYIKMERDFIERTLRIIDQYEELVRGKVPFENEYEVTLLMNCLMGLLIYPQQIAHRKGWNRWLTNRTVMGNGDDWGIQVEFIHSSGHTKSRNSESNELVCEPLKLETLTLRQLLRQMRNTAAHAGIFVSEDTANPGQIGWIVFQDKKCENGFHLRLPIASLDKFVRQLAQSALDNLNLSGKRKRG